MLVVVEAPSTLVMKGMKGQQSSGTGTCRALSGGRGLTFTPSLVAVASITQLTVGGGCELKKELGTEGGRTTTTSTETMALCVTISTSAGTSRFGVIQ